MTLEAWVRPSALGTSWRTVLFKERSGGVVYSLYANQYSGLPVGQVYIGGEQNATGIAQLALDTWTHVAVTFDGTSLRLYVDGTLANTTAVSGAMGGSDGPLRIGGNAIWNEWFDGLIDELRIYDRALSPTEIQTDMQTPVADTSPPSVPGGLIAATSGSTVNLSWTASSDNVGVSRYDLYRSTSAGFTPSPANRIGQPTGTSYTDPSLAAGSYYYRVAAEDAAGNLSAPSNEANATVSAQAPGELVAAYGFRGGEWGRGRGLLGERQHGHDRGCELDKRGQVRLGALLQRRRQLGHDPGLKLPPPSGRADNGGLGQTQYAHGLLAHRAAQGTPRRPLLRAIR